MSEQEINNGLRWYVIHTYSGYENKVKTDIEKMVDNRGLNDLVKEVSVPLEDVVEVKEKSKNLAVIKSALENRVHTPAFVEVDEAKLSGKFARLPERSELNQEINESLIVEYYNRMG